MDTIKYKNKEFYYADFYVSANGDDSWSGKFPEPNEDGSDGPFATINRARDTVRVVKRDIYRNIYIFIRGGEYKLSETVVFNNIDSHYDSYKIIYSAYPGELPIFSSDVEIDKWKLEDKVEGLPENAKGHVFSADLPELPDGRKTCYTLYDNGKMQKRASSKGFEPTDRYKSDDGAVDDFKVMASADRNILYCPQVAIKDWNNTKDVEIFIQPNVGYITNYLPIESADEKEHKVTTAVPATYVMGRIDKHVFAFEEGSFRVENAIGYLDTPGEWVVDTGKRKIYYWPEKGKPEKVVVPALTEYFLIDGHDCGAIVKNIGFKGLTFTRAERDVITKSDIGLQHDWDMWNKANAMLRFRDAEYCFADACRFTESGSAGIRLDLHCQSNEIKNNLIDYVGGTGILLCGYGPGRVNVNKCNRILNNHIHHCGELYYQSNAIMLWQSSENIVRNNKLHHLPYDAIVLSGVRPTSFNIDKPLREMVGTIRRDEIAKDAQYQNESDRESIHKQWMKIAPYYQTRNNTVEDNEIFCAMLKMFDGNAIYLSDVGSGNEVKRNYIHHLYGLGMQQGIRTDAFIKDTLITQNIIYNCNGGGINTKYFENNVINNIIADIRDIVYENSQGEVMNMFIGYVSLLEVYVKSKMPPNAKLEIKNNIFYKTYPHQPFYRKREINGKLEEVHLEECDIDNNLYFDAYADDKGKSRLKYYHSRGIDGNSMATDPMFMDIFNGDFRLKEGSPAYKVGFKNIDMSAIGLTDDYPEYYEETVRRQLGNDYDDFHRLENICDEKENEKKELLAEKSLNKG